MTHHQGHKMTCDKCGRAVEPNEAKHGATRCRLCRDPLKGFDGMAIIAGAIVGGRMRRERARRGARAGAAGTRL